MSTPRPTLVPTPRQAAVVAVAVLVLPLTLLAGMAPAAALVVAGLGVLAGIARLASVRTALLAVLAALACLAAALAVAAWPATLGLAAAVTGILLLARRWPEWALAAAVLLFGFEGSAKVLLGLEPTPLPFTGRAVGAGALDLTLLVAILGVLTSDRAASPRAMWRELSRGERVVAGLLGAWLALSVVQIAFRGDLVQGLDGFRLFQAYVLVAAASATVFWRATTRAPVVAALAVGLLVSGYAALRVIVGPAAAEVQYAVSVEGVATYGNAIRAIGSFSGAVGMASFLTPVSVFALVAGLLIPRVRRLAWATAACAVIGIVASYGRAPLFGIALGLGCVLILLVSGSHLRSRSALVAVGLLAGVLVVAYAGVRVASEGTPQLRERAQGVLNPVGDESVQIRADTWKRSIDTAVSHPLGKGVGAVGNASLRATGDPDTTDNSFLKVLVEQGFLGALLFCAAMLGATWAIGRRLRRASGERRAVGLAALGGFIAFLGLAATGEYVEQPGKVAAWALFGLAAVQALRRSGVTDLAQDGRAARVRAADTIRAATTARLPASLRALVTVRDARPSLRVAEPIDLRDLLRRTATWQLVAWVLALLVVPALTFSSIVTNGANVPFHDEFTGLLPLFREADAGTLDISAFFAQHNEHRPAVPRIIQFGLAHVTNWDIRAELYLNFAVALATFVALLAAMRRTLDRRGAIIASVVASVIFFSPVQWENWLWGWQLGWFLSNLAAVGTLWALTVLLERSPGWGIAVGAACAVVATFSLAQGLLLWPVGLALLVLRRRPAALWAVLSAAAFALYFSGWVNSTPKHSAGPLDYIEFVCLYLGRTFGVNDPTGKLVGAALILSFAGAAVHVVANRRDTDLVDRAAFWLGAGSYALGTAVITAIGRAEPGAAAVSRYSGMASLFAIATMALLFVAASSEAIGGRAVTVTMRRVGMAAVAVPLILAAAVNLRPGFVAMDKRGTDLTTIANCTHRITRLEDPCLDHPLPVQQRERFAGVLYLRSKGWAGY